MANAAHDNNRVPTLIGVSSIDLLTPTRIAANSITGAILIDGTSLYTTLDSRYVLKSGDTMTGALNITSTTSPQLQANYDGTTNWSINVSSSGIVQYNANGSLARHAFWTPNWGTILTLQDSSGTATFGGNTRIQRTSTSAFLVQSAAGATTYFTVDTSTPKAYFQNANVGIGTANPQANLHLIGTLLFSPSDNNYGMFFTSNNNGSQYSFEVGTNSYVTNSFTITPSTLTGGHAFSTPIFTLLRTGNLGINTNAPTSKLHILSSSAGSGIIVDDNSVNGWGAIGLMNVGIGIDVSGATCLGFRLNAPQTGYASLRWSAGTTPTSPTDGDSWYDGTHLKINIGSTVYQLDQQGVSNYAHTIFTPSTGGTVALVNNQYNIINPAGALLALTVNLPSSPANNDVVFIKFTQNVSTVTYGNGTVVDGITAPTAGGLTVLVYDSSAGKWY